MSKQGRILMDLIRQLTDAESFGIARSPLVPKTAAEFAGPKADIPETEAEELKAKIEKQEEVQKKQKDAQWETNQVLRPSEKVETCIKTTPTSRSAARLGMEDRSPIARIEEADIS
ncbi:hypothetical protein N656DRAFT_775708 [Canariomyces notabilis]|uniref:Uncharacterized protein n=1 Tax=Canariomyces notabilis TaxID=2074819 RepID=A0AAN6TJQ4_9PEZI|nr:hypothetical protein N656DRAFT_775708 [Canariomyces arenarius]